MGSSYSLPDLKKKEYRNWLTVGRAILITHAGVAPLIQKDIDSWHKALLLFPRLSTCGPCTCATTVPLRNCVTCRCTKKTHKSCKSCVCPASPSKCPFCAAWKDELESLKRGGAIIFENAWENCTWADFDKLPWEVAKLFMAPLGSRKTDVKDAFSTDFGGLMNLLERCPFIVPPVIRAALRDVRDKVRNLWAHAPNHELSDAEMSEAERFLHVLLADAVFVRDPDAQAADKELQQLFKDGLVSLRDAEFEVMKQLKVVLGQEIETLREDCKNKDENQNRKIKKLEKMTKDVTSGLEKRMQEVEVKTDEHEKELQNQNAGLSKVEVKTDEHEKELQNQNACLSKIEVKTDEHEMELRNQNACLSKVEFRTDEHEKELQNQSTRLSKVEDKQVEQREALKKKDFNLAKCQDELKKCYLDSLTHVQLTPWDASDTCHIDDVYTKLSWVKQTRNVQGITEGPLQHYRDIFQTDQHRLTIVEGQAGVGKSTFTKRLAVDWAQGKEKVLKRFKLLLIIKLRDVSSISSFTEALKTCVGFDSEAEAEQLLQYVTENQEKCLIVFDGLDEYEFSPENDIVRVMKGQMLRKCRVLVTTRPSAVELIRGFSHAHCKIAGFDDDDIKEYVSKHFGSEKEVKTFVTYLKRSSLISLAKIPLLCLFLCLLWKLKKSKDFPTTRTELYKEIMQCIIDHSESKTDCTTSKSIDDYDIVMREIGRVSYDALKRDSLIFDAKELSEIIEAEDIKSLGLISTANIRGRKAKKSVEFLHKSLQEFAAAWYVAKCLEENPGECQLLDDLQMTLIEEFGREIIEKLQCLFCHSKDMVRFICGLSTEAAKEVLKKLSDLKKNLQPKNVSYEFDGFYNSNIFALFDETKCSPVIKELFFDLCSETLVVRGNDFPSEAKVVELFKLGLSKLVVYFFRGFHYSDRISEILSLFQFIDVKLPAGENCFRADAVKFMKRLFDLKDRRNFTLLFCIRKVEDKYFILEMYGILNVFGSSSVSDILPLISEYPKGLIALDCMFSEVDVVPFQEFCNLGKLQITENSPKSLQVIDLGFIRELRVLCINGVDAAHVYSLQYLNQLVELSLCSFTDQRNVVILAKHFSKMAHLKVLTLDGFIRNSAAPRDVAELAAVLDGTPELVKLNLNRNYLGDDVTFVAQQLCKVPHLKVLSLERTGISANGLEKLSTALACIPHLMELNLSGNPLADGVVSLASYLSRVPLLERLQLGDVKMTDEGAIAVAEALCHIPLLKALNLSDNREVDHDTWRIFASKLHHLKLLRLYNLFNCGLTNDVQHEIRSAVPNATCSLGDFFFGERVSSADYRGVSFDSDYDSTDSEPE